MHIPAPVTLVTGSSRGLGLEIATQFQNRGDKIHAVWHRDEERGKYLQEEFVGRNHRCDLTSEEAASGLVERLLEIDGKLDHAVHCVGDFFAGSLADTEPDDWRALFESNVASAVNLAHAAREPLRESGGTLVFFCCAGVADFKARRSCGAYASMKAALMAFARSLALEEAPFGVRVNTISPGWVTHEDSHPRAGDEHAAERVPLGRAGRPEEVAAAAIWLSSSESTYATGLDLSLSGGWPR